MSRAKSIMIVLVALAVIAVVVVVAARRASLPVRPEGTIAQRVREASTDNAETKPTFVGRMVCKECHSENFNLHAHSGHAHTFALASEPKIADKFVDREFDAGDPFGTFRYFSDQQELRVRRLDGAEDETIPLQFALGSGEHAITLLSLFDDETEGPLGIEHRVTWFAPDQELGHTPGHDYVPAIELELFGLAHTGENLQDCVSCHSTTGKVVGTEIVDHVPNVNCERCHGPGSEHVKQARASDNPPPFSIGRADWTTESELRLCGSCHRLPRDVTRKQLRQYEANLVRFQPIGLVRSECYLQSDFDLRCTHCHNPHMAAKEKSHAAYVQDCVDCHLEDSPAHVACPVSPTDGCIECHMPKVEFEHGVVFHDHWIRITEDESGNQGDE